MFMSRTESLLQRPCAVCAARRGPPLRHCVRAAAPTQKDSKKPGRFGGLGDLLGPIGLTLGSKLTGSREKPDHSDNTLYRTGEQTDNGEPSSSHQNESIHEMTTDQWRNAYEREGCVDLWVEEEFNSGSRLMGGRAAHKGQGWGIGSGEGPSVSNAPRHTVTIHNHHANQDLDVDVPEDRVKEGVMSQPEALGISKELKDQGFALMCVGYPKTDLVLETVEEDEIYDMQFGHIFNEQAVDPKNKKFVERDDFALEVANMDE